MASRTTSSLSTLSLSESEGTMDRRDLYSRSVLDFRFILGFWVERAAEYWDTETLLMELTAMQTILIFCVLFFNFEKRKKIFLIEFG